MEPALCADGVKCGEVVGGVGAQGGFVRGVTVFCQDGECLMHRKGEILRAAVGVLPCSGGRVRPNGSHLPGSDGKVRPPSGSCSGLRFSSHVIPSTPSITVINRAIYPGSPLLGGALGRQSGRAAALTLCEIMGCFSGERRMKTGNSGGCIIALAAVCGMMGLAAQADIILDNGDRGTWSSGTWRSQATKHMGKTVYGLATGDIHLGVYRSAVGTYEVLMWWSGWSSRASVVNEWVVCASGRRRW